MGEDCLSMAFFFPFLFRLVSGLQNGFGYDGNSSEWRFAMSALMLLSSLLLSVLILVSDLRLVYRIIGMIFCYVASFGAYGVEDSFNRQINLVKRSIHLYELLATGALVVALVFYGCDLIQIVCSVYPSLILHKGAINIGVHKKRLGWKGAWKMFFDEATDDPEGKYYSFTLFGKTYRVPRLSTTYRIALAVLSILIAILAAILKINYTIYSFL